MRLRVKSAMTRNPSAMRHYEERSNPKIKNITGYLFFVPKRVICFSVSILN
jgi:hypothetical protein